MSYDSWKLATPYDNEPDIGAIAAYYDVHPSNVTDTMVCHYQDDRAADYGDREYDRLMGK